MEQHDDIGLADRRYQTLCEAAEAMRRLGLDLPRGDDVGTVLLQSAQQLGLAALAAQRGGSALAVLDPRSAGSA